MMARKKTISSKRLRNRQTDRNESKRFASKISLAMVVVGATIGLVAVANKWIAREGLHTIVIKGNLVLDTSEVLAQSDIPDSVRLKALDLEEIEKRLSAHPFVAKAVAWEGGNGSLVLEVEERIPVVVAIVDGKPLYLDQQGVALPFRFGVASPDVPLLIGIFADGEIDSLKALEAIGVVETLRGYSDLLYRRIAEVHRSDDGVYTFRLTDNGVPVIAGLAGEIGPRLPKLEAFLTEVLPYKGAHSLRSVDLRWRGQVVVRWKEERKVT